MKYIKIVAVLAAAVLLGAGCSGGSGKCPDAPRGVHEYLEWQVVDPATCQKTGIRERSCKYCTASQRDVIPKTDHLLTNYTAESSAHWKECAYCHQQFERGAHEFGGNICSICGYDDRGTAGLVFTLSRDGRYYSLTSVSGVMPAQVTIPETYCFLPVREIGENAFDKCTQIVSISIPKGVTAIGEDAFAGCVSLERITVDPENAAFTAEGGILYQADKSAFVHVPAQAEGKIVVPDAVREIGREVFAGRKISEIVLPQGLRTICAKAFENCDELQEIVVPSSVTKIEKGAFEGCTSLNRLVLPIMWQDGLTTPSVTDEDRWIGNSFIGYIFGAELYASTAYQVPESLKEVEFTGGTTLNKYCFQRCEHLERVILPDTLRTIEANAFEDCASLQEVRLKEGLETVAANAFAGCSSLTAFSVPASVTQFDPSALSRCASLSSVEVKTGNTQYAAQDGILYNHAKTSILAIPAKVGGAVTIPEGIRILPDGGFAGSEVTSVSIPSTVTRIGERCFENCTQLTEVTIPSESALLTFGDYAFANCTQLREIDVPATVTQIGIGAFVQSGLQQIRFADPAGWQYSDSPASEGTPVAPALLQNPTTAAQQLTGIIRYWSKK